MRPLIGLTVGCAPGRDGYVYARLRATYIRAVQDAGGVPLLVPPHADRDALVAVLERLDGLLLPGGDDVDPVEYGETAQGAEPPNPALDALELTAARWAIQRDLPTLGICRGQQVVNVAMGGSLIQHMDGHAPEGPRDTLHHALRVAPDSRLARALGSTDMQVNSHHHQAVKRLADGLVAVAWAEDGTIEGIEAPDKQWLLAVQFHPEDLVGGHAPSEQLFESFIAACRANASTPAVV
jgi:putative glutamine amidotransferase